MKWTLILCFTAVLFGQNSEESTIHSLLNQWHKAAAIADEELFFGSMAKDAIYLGTDKSERWLRDELKAWSAKYFERDKAWDFKPYDRHIYFSADGKTAWFEESLETWMDVCRGSGVLEKINGVWRIKHYHLSVTIDNDLIKDFISLVTKERTRPQ